MSNKGKRIYLIIIWVITLAVIIFGTYRFIGNGLDWIFSFGGGDAVTKTVDLSPDVSEINVEVKSANVLIQEGDMPGVAYTFPEKANINLTQENGVLRLSQDKDSNVVSFGSSKREVVITLPREKTLARVNVKTKSGNIELNGIHCDDVVANADSGNIKVDGKAIKRLNSEADSGNIEIIGDMENINVEADSGNINVKGNTPTIKCDADSGNITISGNLDNVNAKADSGDIKIDSDKSEQEMHLKLDTDSGKITVNGQKYK